MPSIDNFKSAFQNLARPNLFKVRGFGLGRNLEFLAKASSIPASTLGSIEVPYMGRKIKIAGDREYAEWTMTIYNDQDFDLRNQLEDWQAIINEPVSNVGVNEVEAYKREGEVIQFGRNEDVIARYTIIGAFPTEIGEIELDWEQNDTVEEFSVTFMYDYFTRS